MASPRVTYGSQRGNRTPVPFGTRVGVLDVRTEGGEPALLTVTLEPIANERSTVADPLEVEGVATLEWGVGQGAPHRAELDVGRGLALTIAAAELRVDVMNVGGGHEPEPDAVWRASACLGATARVTKPVRSLRFGALAREEQSDRMLLPAFAFEVNVQRAPQAELRLSWFGGAGQLLAEHHLPRDVDRSIPVPSGAHLVQVTNLDDPLFRGRLVFGLAL